MKKITLSILAIGIAAAAVIGGTWALFSDTETSSGNILQAGELDLKVDHVRQTYNDVDCKTCQVVLVSDNTNNMVTAKNGTPMAPYAAVYVGANSGGWIHPAWTAEEDPILSAAGAKWIWESDPTKVEDLTNNAVYTFENDFEWWGPITGSDLWMAVGSDNSVKVYLNGVLIGENAGEYGYKKESMLHIPAASITNNIQQGNNVLKFEVKNWALIGSTPQSNPAGLVYKFSIDGQCLDDYFKTHCTLWGEKDLTAEDKFFNLDDVKPGDRGTNIISLHLYDNPGWACLLAHDKTDLENDLVDPEEEAGDTTPDAGELAQGLEVMLWKDINANFKFDASEPVLYEGTLADDVIKMKVADSTTQEPLQATTTYYVGLAWCFGDQVVDQQQGTITCDGALASDRAQTDSLSASLTIYTEQHRHNETFDCSQLVWPIVLNQ